MGKVYIVTDGDYSDYHIEACFSTKEKAEKFIDNGEKIKYFGDNAVIEEWELDKGTEIVDVITIRFTFTSPFSKLEHREKIKSDVTTNVKYRANEYTDLYGIDYEILYIRRIANPNKSIEDEISRCIKIAYDTAKRIKYLYEVENVKSIEKMKARLNGVE